MTSVLVVAAHPDDEVLGCGGTIARHADASDQVQVLIVAEGATSRQQHRSRLKSCDELSALAKAARKAGSILGAAGVDLLDFPDNRLDSLDRLDLIKRIEECIDRHQPQVVYVHHAGDVNVDHRRLHEAVVTACRPIPGHPVRRLLSFEVSSSTEWQPPGSSSAPVNWLSIFLILATQARSVEGICQRASLAPCRSLEALLSTLPAGAVRRWVSKQLKHSAY